MTSAALIVFGLVTLLGLVSLLPPLAAKLKLPYSVLLALAGLWAIRPGRQQEGGG